MAFRLTLTSPRGAKGLRKTAKAARDEALRAAGEHWCKEILPGHFKAGAEAKYRYPKRTKKHMRRKSREGRGADPNVYTGRLAQKMMTTKPVVTVNKRGLVLVFKGLPKYTFVIDTWEFVKSDPRWDDALLAKLDPKARAGILRWRMEHPETKDGRYKKVKRPNKPEEITAMTGADADAVGKVFRRTYTGKLKELTQ